jgi:hypothetical protein
MKNRGINHRIRKRLIERALKKNKREVLFPSFHDVKSIGIVSDSSINYDFSTNRLTSNCKLTSIVVKSKKRGEIKNSEFIFKDDLNFWGLPKKKFIDNFINKPFDILLDVSCSSHDVINYICAKSPARFKISTKNSSRVFDLIISQKQVDVASLMKEIEQILINFNSKT